MIRFIGDWTIIFTHAAIVARANRIDADAAVADNVVVLSCVPALRADLRLIYADRAAIRARPRPIERNYIEVWIYY